MAAAIALGGAAPAGADTYTVHGCRTPAGAPTGAAGWSLSQAGSASATDTCREGGALTVGLHGGAPGGSVARARFEAPAGTRIVRLYAQRKTYGVHRSAETLDAIYELSTDGAVLEKCALAIDSACDSDLSDPIDRQGLDAAWARFTAVCAEGGDERCGEPMRVEIPAAAVALRDLQGPIVGGVRVVDDGESSGVLRVTFDAADTGGGLYRAVVRVDGAVHSTANLGAADCQDANPTDADPYQFLVPVPCPPLAIGVPVEVGAAALPRGPHTVQIDVEDAAGNATAVHVTQFPRLNGVTATGASQEAVARLLRARVTARFVTTGSRRATSRFGTRVVIRGRLVDPRSGRGIVGARIDVDHLVGKGRRIKSKTGLKTRAGGRLTLILPLNVDTRRIRLAYRAVRPGAITSSATLRLTVRDARGRVVRRAR